ncbi:putative polygalacturonase [Arachis hypogaea]|nr:putative polygalacturonase [Arachis hypogaea]
MLVRNLVRISGLYFPSFYYYLFQVALLLLLAWSNAVIIVDGYGGQCSLNPTLDPRLHSVSILEFGAVGDGKTLNTIPFQNVVFYLKCYYYWISGNNGTINGMGSVWWEWFTLHTLNHIRPHLIELVESDYVVVSNLTILNPRHTQYTMFIAGIYVHIQNVSISALAESPFTVGIVPDSSNNVCIEDCIVAMGHDAISLKSGWDEYGVAYGRPTENVHIRRVTLSAFSGSTLAFGSEMSGGLSNVFMEHSHVLDSDKGVQFRTTRGRGGYMKEIVISDIQMDNVYVAIAATGHCSSHPNDKFDPNALPHLDFITLKGVIGRNITVAGSFAGIEESPFTNICLSNITLSINSISSAWECSNVLGSSNFVNPEPGPELRNPTNSSLSCFYLLSTSGRKASAL